MHVLAEALQQSPIGERFANILTMHLLHNPVLVKDLTLSPVEWANVSEWARSKGGKKDCSELLANTIDPTEMPDTRSLLQALLRRLPPGKDEAFAVGVMLTIEEREELRSGVDVNAATKRAGEDAAWEAMLGVE